MKQTHGIVLWLAVLSAIFPIADGVLNVVPPDLAPSQTYRMSNFAAVLMMAAIILGTACVFEGKRHL